MLVGSAGVVTVIATLLLSFVNADRTQTLARLGVLIVALAVVLVIARSRRVDAMMMHVIGRALDRWTDIDARDYMDLLHLGQGYSVNELEQEEKAARRAGDISPEDAGKPVRRPPDGAAASD